MLAPHHPARGWSRTSSAAFQADHAPRPWSRAGAEPWSQQDQSSLSRCRPAPPGASGAATQLARLEDLTILDGDPTILGWELENLTAWAVTQQAAGAAPDLRLHPSNMCCSLLLEN